MSTLEFDGLDDRGSRLELRAEDAVKFITSLKISPSNNLGFTDITSPYVGVVQIYAREFSTLEDYIREMNMIVTQGVNQRAQIICFPEFTGLLPASLFPQYKRVIDSYPLDNIQGIPSDMWIYKAFVGLASECFEIYFATMSALAAAHEVYIMAGTSIYSEKGEHKNRGLMFGPNGKLLGYQDKLTTDIIGDTMKIDQGDRLKIFDTLIGKFGVAIGNDADNFEVFKVAQENGVKVVINPAVHVAPFSSVDAAGGINLRVQEYNMFGIQPIMIGKLPFGITLEGESGIFAPSNFTSSSSKNNMYVRAMKTNQTQVITTKLNHSELESSKDILSHGANSEFMKKYIGYLY